MRYDRPVRELLVECCRELPEPFGPADVVRWFQQRYPEVATNTVRTQFSTLLGRGELPVVRAGRGSYRRTSEAPPVAGPEILDRPRAEAPRVVLLGCVKSKAAIPAPARELYTSTLWHRRLAYAENAGLSWFVLSAKHGVVDPDDVISPYDVSLRAASSAYRTAWGAFVAQQLATRFPLRGLVVEVHAGDPYVEAIRAPLARLGAVIDDPVDATSMGATLAWYDEPAEPREYSAPATAGLDEQVAAALAALDHADEAVRPAELRNSPSTVVDRPGLYSWWVDPAGAADLSRGLGVTVASGLVYAGQAGASRSGGSASANTLRGRLVGMHLEGSRRMSTLRKSLSAVLDHAYGIDGGEDELTAWMHEHLRVALWPTDDRDALRLVEERLLASLDPPLNLRHMAPTPLRQRLSQLRASVG